MNTECVIVSNVNRADQAALENLAAYFQRLESDIEIYPVTVSRITAEVSCYKTYDEAAGWRARGQRFVLKPGDLVLFVAGKYHYMSKRALRTYAPPESKNALVNFTILHPAFEGRFFDDIIEY